MTFLKAVVEISKQPKLELCDHPDEISGEHTCICVYHDDVGFVGKLRWPQHEKKILASVDPELECVLAALIGGEVIDSEAKHLEILSRSCPGS